MSDFDPYLKWLGIRDPQRPPNHYRLLGLDPFESDIEIISMAADRQMSHVRSYQNGPNGDKSQQLLNELARARRCLLTVESKAEYDAQLRKRIDAEQGNREVAPEIPIAINTSNDSASIEKSIAVQIDPAAKSNRKKRERGELIGSLIGWVLGGVAALAVGAFLLSSGWLTGGQNNHPQNPDPAVTQLDVETKKKDKVEVVPVSPNTKINPDKPPTIKKNENSVIKQPSENIVSNQPAPLPLDHDESLTVSLPSPLMPSEGTWTLGNISDYPIDVSSLNLLSQKMADDLSDGGYEIVDGLISNVAPGQNVDTDRADRTKVLVGLRVWLNDQSYVAGIQGIYLHSSGIIAGKQFGTQSRHYRDMIGNPGYAVSAISVSAESPVKSVALKFMRWTSRGMKPDETYESDRIGKFGGPLLTLGGPSFDLPIIGDSRRNFEIHEYTGRTCEFVGGQICRPPEGQLNRQRAWKI